MTYENNGTDIPAFTFDALHALPTRNSSIWLDREEDLLPSCAFGGEWTLLLNRTIGLLTLSNKRSGDSIEVAQADNLRDVAQICNLFAGLAHVDHGYARTRGQLPRDKWAGLTFGMDPGAPVRPADLLPDDPELVGAVTAALTLPIADYIRPWGGMEDRDVMGNCDHNGRVISITSQGRLVVSAPVGADCPRILDWCGWHEHGEPRDREEARLHYGAVALRWTTRWQDWPGPETADSPARQRAW